MIPFSLVALRTIHPDTRFRFTSPGNKNQALAESIKKRGVLNPLPVWKEEGGLRLIAGFSRFEAACEAGHHRMPVRLLDPNLPLLVHLLAEVESHTLARPLNLVEKARLLRLLKEENADDELLKDFCFLLDLPLQQRLLHRIEAVLELSPTVLDYIETNSLSLKQAEMFLGLSQTALEKFIALAAALRLRPRELSEIITLASDLSREDRDNEGTFLPAHMAEIIEDEKLSREERLRQIKQALMEQRFPWLSGYRRELEELIRALRSPARLRLDWDRTLEKPGLELWLSLANLKDVDDFEIWLKESRVHDILNELFKRL